MTNNSIRKKSTLRRIGNRRAWKSFSLPALAALAGIGLKLFYDYQPVEALINWLQASWLLFTDQQALEAWISIHPTIQWLIGWTASPTVLFLLGWAIAKLPPTKWLIDRIFPDPPTFVFTDLTAEREATMSRLDRNTLPLIGRNEELAGLLRLLDKDAVAPIFRWQMLSGPSGVGKTRLAIEWLENAKTAGWDFGIIDPDDSELLSGWRARRPTALVIDEARSAWSGELEKAISRLQSGSGKGRPVRVLVIAQIAPYASGAAPEEIKDSETIPLATLAPLENEYLAELAEALETDTQRAGIIVRESGGRPRAAIILANAKDATDLTSAMAAWAFRVVPELRSDEGSIDESLALGIIASGLAGPFPTTQLQGITKSLSVLPLLRFFPSVRQDALEETLPALIPEDLGHELALRMLPRLGSAMRGAVIQLLIEQEPARMEASLGNIWRDHPGYSDGTGEHGKNCTAAGTLRSVQATFDERWPDRVEASRKLAGDLLDLTAMHDTGRDALEQHLSTLVTLANSRPFDDDMRLREVAGVANAIIQCCLSNNFTSLERWGTHLIALAERPDLKQNADVRLHEARAASAAIACFSETKHFEALEYWGARLIKLAEHSDLKNNVNIRAFEANGAVSMMGHHRKAKDFKSLQRWGERVIALAEHPDFKSDPEICYQEALGAATAMLAYGTNKEFVALERWGTRLIALAEQPAFGSNYNIRRQEAMSAANTINQYGEAADFNALERWGTRLIALAEHSDFANNASIRQAEARGAVNAIIHYGTARDFEALERWGTRLIALAEHPDFASNADIRWQEGNAAVDAMSCYGSTRNFEALERWGTRLIALADRPDFASNADIRLSEAKGIFNAMNQYAKEKDFVALERWGARLVALAEHSDFQSHSDIRLEEAKGAFIASVAIRNDGRSGSAAHNNWHTRLAKVALEFPYHGQIQFYAKNRGVDYLEQRSRGWPYGNGKLPLAEA
jgi:hypothetical protein